MYGLKGTQPILYHEDEVIKAQEVHIPEGEKNADDLRALGWCATTNPMGAGKWKGVCSEGKPPAVLKDKDVIIYADNDKVGREHAQDIARSIHRFAATVKILYFPDLPEKGDVSDFIEQHGPDEAKRLLSELAAKTPEYEPAQEPKKTKKKEKHNEKDEKESRFMQLLGLFYETGADVFWDEHSRGWTCLKIGGATRNVRINSAEFNRFRLRLYVDTHGQGIGRETITQVGDLLEARATETKRLYNRFAWVDGILYVDLCNSAWEAIEVSADGWRKVQLEKPLFKRFRHQQPLPEPERGGKLDEILSLIPVKREAEKILLQVWMVCAPLEHVGRPGLILHGDQGSAKTKSAEKLGACLDPSLTKTLSLPENHAEFVQALDHYGLMRLDNLRGLPPWASDDLCRAITGGGLTKRGRYTNDDDFIFEFCRTFILNGIAVAATSPDLLDRSILVELERIEDTDRRCDGDLDAEFDRSRPRIFGAILDCLAKTIAIRPSVKLNRLPRMADFTMWGYAAAEALGLGGPEFLKAYNVNIATQNDQVVGSNPICMTLVEFMNNRLSWFGTPSELYSELKSLAKDMELTEAHQWPKAANTFSKSLRQLVTNLKESGLVVEAGKSGLRKITVRKIPTSQESTTDEHATKKSSRVKDPQEQLDLNAPDTESRFECTECAENHEGTCNLCGQSIDDPGLQCPLGAM